MTAGYEHPTESSLPLGSDLPMLDNKPNYSTGAVHARR